jgi:hypothetical protein
MKKILILVINLYVITLFAQVGIGTSNPTADFDVNGNVRIRNTNSTNNSTAAKDSILVVDYIGNIKRISSKSIVQSHYETFVKGSFTSSSDVNLALVSGTKKIPFDFEEFDTNNEFDTTTSVLIAKKSGIYNVTIQIKAVSSIAIATDFGVAILKNGLVVNKNSAPNVGILGTNVTPPFRSLSTLVSLVQGDTLTFNVVSSLLNLGVLGNKEDCYFTIYQVR